MHAKGWTSAEIEHAMYHMNVAEQRKHPFVKFTESSTYWIVLFAIGVFMYAFTIFLFPFFTILPLSVSLTLDAVVGLIAGILFGYMLHSIDELTHKHHAFVMLFTIVLTLAAGWQYKLYAIVLAAGFCVQYIYYWWTK